MSSQGDLEVCVVGAGVVGLTTALLLQNEFPNANLSIVANLFNQETTSDGAAGLFYPGSSYSGPTLEITKKWISDSYSYYDGLRISSEGERAGVFPISGYKFSRFSPKEVMNSPVSTEDQIINHYMEEVAPVFRYATEEELKLCPGNWKYGTYCSTLGIEGRLYLPWALSSMVRGDYIIY
ncbi:hypothetical protein J437_LFUL014588 [Ladona fulva]|uniref:FAD dependent oxidoreductase domain-containing protein n=1 Tax=Ladona fulva TaxID=123851 RepID=A0A8K0K129_LADFU|nr:hypothetical protein J437_LFUL014588 [Ladona fulva]